MTLHPLLRAMLDADGADAATYYGARDAWLSAGRPRFAEPPANTVKVRIAVVTTRRHWIAAGEDDDSARHLIPTTADLERELGGGRLSWVTAHVPLPEPAAEIVGEVSDG